LTDATLPTTPNQNKTASTILMTPRRGLVWNINFWQNMNKVYQTESHDQVIRLEDSVSQETVQLAASQINFKEDLRRKILENEWQRHEISVSLYLENEF